MSSSSSSSTIWSGALKILDLFMFFHLVKSWTRLGRSVTLSLQERNEMPVSDSYWWLSWSSMNLNSLAWDRQGIFWVCECGKLLHGLLWWYWWLLNTWLGSITAPFAVDVAAAALALLSSFLNRIPQALQSDWTKKQTYSKPDTKWHSFFFFFHNGNSWNLIKL